MGFTAEEREAMRIRNRELNAQSKADRKRSDDEKDLLDALGQMEGLDKELATQLHRLVTERAPQLAPKTWYGMPSWALDGKVVCFFQPSLRFKTRYATVGFNDAARLDNGSLWPTAFAVTAWTPEVEARLGELLTRA